MIKPVRCLILASLAGLFLAGGIITLWPGTKPQAILQPDGWNITEGFYDSGLPDIAYVRQEVITDPAFRTWRSWSPTLGTTPGHLESKPFSLPPHLLLTFYGFANPEKGVDLNLICASNKSTMRVGQHDALVDWAERIVDIDPSWCPDGQGQLIADSDSTVRHVATATPFAIGQIDTLKTSLPALVFIYTTIFTLLALPFLLACKISREKSWLPIGCTLLIGQGMTAFFAFWLSRTTGLIVTGGLEFILIFSCVAAWWQRRHIPLPGNFAPIMGGWFIGGLFFTLLLYSVDNGLGSWAANGRFWPAEWSTDNQLPFILAERLYRGGPIVGMFGVWQVSDRPPLLAGLYLYVRELFALMPSAATPSSMAVIWYQLAGIVCNGLWLPIIAWGAERCGMRKYRAQAVAALMAIAPFLLFNTIYAWPKMLGGALALLVIFLLIATWQESRRLSVTETILCGLLAAGALLAHGGTIYGLVVLALWLLLTGQLPGWRALVAGGTVFLGAMLPWMLWQHFAEPPGNALIKFAFAGTFGFEDKAKSVTATIIDAYRTLGPDGWLQQKWQQIVLPFWPVNPTFLCDRAQMGGCTADILNSAARRNADFIQPFGTLGAVQYLLPLLLLPILKHGWRNDNITRLGFFSFLYGFATIQLTWLVTLAPSLAHHQSYQALLAMLFGLICLLEKLPRLWRQSIALLVMLYPLAIWIIPTTLDALQINPATLIACITIFVTAGAFIVHQLGQSPKSLS